MAASLWWDEPEVPGKSDEQNKNDDLLVFGYACKVFRDDEKARAIDKGKLLIPWMGDERLMIDRYDGRGHLFDLAQHDSDNVKDKNPDLSEEEEAIEKACEEERYLELHTDLREAQIYEEEEWKRYYLSLQEGYQAVGFSYDQQHGGIGYQEAAASEVKEEEDTKPFVPPVELHVPQGMQAPTCVKHNARIEKTASFIAQHGIQMEIMLKTKQAGNPQFDFLHFENELNPYYKHVVQMIKSGKYKPQEEEDETKKDDDHSHDYLHPSLSSAPQLPPPPPPPSKPIELPKVSIHDTPYGALINSIRKNTETSRASASSQAQSVTVSSQYGTYTNTTDSGPYNPPPPGTEPVTLPMVSSLNGQDFMEQLYGPTPAPEKHDTAPYPSRDRRKKRSSSSDSSSSSSSSHSSRSSSQKSKSPRRSKQKAPQKVEGPHQIISPPADVQPIIDRMAMYVAKNGAEFEMVVMRRQDPRFQFLNEYHAHFPYYKLKKDRYLQELGKAAQENANGQEKRNEERGGSEERSNSSNQRSISFSIKTRPKEQEGGQSQGKPHLFEYDSSEGEEGKKEREREQSMESRSESGSATPTTRVYMDEDSQKEMEEKLKDKLASAVKERISQTHKEKQLQLERKKKAAMFLNLIKSSQPAPADSTPPMDDAAALYVGEPAPAPVVYEYDNQSTPQVVREKRKRSRSPREKKRRRSPTPPSAYSLDRRSPTRPSPSRWSSRPGNWSGIRERTPPWHRRNRDIPPRRSRSRSPHRREEKKKKHKRSKSRSPSRRGKSKEKSRSSKERTKHKSKEKEKKKKEKSRHRSKDRDVKQKSSREKTPPEVMTVSSDKESRNNSDVEMVSSVKSPSDLTQFFTEDQSRMSNGSNSVGLASAVDLSSIPIPGAGTTASSSSSESLNKKLGHSESTNDIPTATSQCNSPSGLASLSRGSTPSRLVPDTTKGSSTDLMSKVRAMLKKSREMILKEEAFTFEDT